MKNFFFTMLASTLLFVSCEKDNGNDGIDPLVITVPALSAISSDTDELAVIDLEGDIIVCRAAYNASTGCTLKLPAVLDESKLISVPDFPGLKVFIGTVRCMKDGGKTGQYIQYGNGNGSVAYMYSNMAGEFGGITVVEGWAKIFMSKKGNALPMPDLGLTWIVDEF